MANYINKKTSWIHCKESDGDFCPELTAYVNTENYIYIRIETPPNDSGHDLQHIVLDADTAEDMARSILKMAKTLKNG